DECALGEDEMSPRKDGKEVAAKRMKPRRPEADENLAPGRKVPVHDAENLGRVLKMFEAVERHDHIGPLVVGRGRERAALMLAGIASQAAGPLEVRLQNIDPYHSGGAMPGQLDGLVPLTTSEIDDRPPSAALPDFRTQQHF